MESQTNLAWDVLLELGRRTGAVNERLTGAIRAAIRDGRLSHGMALPPSRALATELGISRWAVTRSYGQLVAEGYLEGKTGSATRVRWVPDRFDSSPRSAPSSPADPAVRFDLTLGQTDLRHFPRTAWIRAITTAAATASYADFGAPGEGGADRLRTVLAAYVNRVRGAAADPGLVHICFGAGQAMLRICTALHAAGHTALAVEDPGPTRLWQAAILAGLQLVPIDVDADGLVVEQLADHPQVRAVLVGAAHQCPTGVVLAPHRRAQVLRWARDVDGLIIEDDYDAEYRYDRPATATFQGMEPRRVALIGSVSRTLGPAVGIGWAVTPPRWTSPIRHDDFLRLMPPVLNQLALAVMLESGAYDRHLRAARARFRARRAVLLDRLAMDLPDCRVRAAEAGLDILLELPAGRDAWLAVVAARKRGLLCSTLNAFRMRPARQAAPTIVLSYGNLADSAVGEAVGILADAIAGATIRPGVSGPAVTRAVPLQAPADVGTGRPE